MGWDPDFGFSFSREKAERPARGRFGRLKRSQPGATVVEADLHKESRSMEEHATLVVETAAEYVGRWNRLVSTTNWEKGRIICQWRDALRQADAPPAAYTDEAWSREVGGVSPQHVGRLRRVYERFGDVFQDYAGLYWSHFHAALDWPDAEMYLEGAVQNRWSISEMRAQRWEATGAPADEQPREEDVVASEFDEDAATDAPARVSPVISDDLAEVHATGDPSNDLESDAPWDAGDHAAVDSALPASDVPAVRPFASLPPLPSDLSEAFELFKLAILSHKVAGWRDIARDDVLSVLESLRQLALAPAK